MTKSDYLHTIEVLKQVATTLEGLKQEHYVCDDEWYSCPLSRAPTWRYENSKPFCDCGADKNNAEIKSALAIIHQHISELEKDGS